MTTRHLIFVSALLALLAGGATAATPRPNPALRQQTELTHWLFSRDSLTWEPVRVPHDWAIAGPFDKRHDLQVVAITQDGETVPTEKSGRSGALPWIGRGFYTTTLTLTAVPEHAELLFDGAMSEPVVRINGRVAGEWKYGYNAFRIDATPFLHAGENTISVSLNNREESSRWYPGAGLYRPVTLTTTRRVHVDPWGGWVRTTRLQPDLAELDCRTAVRGLQGNERAQVELTLRDDRGKTVASATGLFTGADGTCDTHLLVTRPKPWSPESPTRYTLRRRVLINGKTVDETTEHVGLRTVSVSREGGFQLNGQTRKLKGVCLHHDLGPLGAAVNRAAIVRQIRLLKEMGADAIRTSHNMPSQLQMEVCDSMGMMVMAESFDMWKYAKCRNGYAIFFDQWADRDITNLALHHRNHPSIIMWSIGNEIPEQGSKEGPAMARHLQDLLHLLDPTRPVTQGMDRPDNAISTGFAQLMDVPGFNYRLQRYDDCFPRLPQGFLLGSETASTVSSRGVYKFPVEVKKQAQYPDFQCSSYDTEYCSWSNLPDDDWAMQEDRPWTIGEFVWTGFDYLGEPTPYNEQWPSRSSYFGIFDLAGLPKDRYWLYRAHWQQQDATLHLLPHWTWPGRENELTPVYCYTSYPEAELFVNGKSQGRRRKDASSRLDRYRLRWNDVRYEPGELRVVAYDAQGRSAAEQTLRTAGEPHHLVLTADRSAIEGGNARDLSFITVSVVDRDGNPCPTATHDITFSVTGAGRYVAACNGDATSLVAFHSLRMPLFSGQLVAILEGVGRGRATLHARAEGLPEATIDIVVR